MNRKHIAVMAAGLLMAGAGSLRAQVAWEAPLMAPPRAPAGFGVYVADVAGGDIGVFGTWRGRTAPSGLEFRFGIAEDAADDIAGLFGVTFSGMIARESGDMPFDLSWVAGGGIGFGDFVLLTIPAGVSLGKTFQGEGVTFTPYVTPRLVLDAALGDDDFGGDGDDTDLGLVVDLGFDIGLRRGWALRFGASLGDHEAIAFGIVF